MTAVGKIEFAPDYRSATAYTPWGDQPIEHPQEDTFMPATNLTGTALPSTASGVVNDSFCDRILGPQTKDVKVAIADEAKKIVTGARRSAYGRPEDNFERIARFWQAYFLNTGRDVEVTAADVSPLMRLMKEARLCETPDHRDSFVDLVGYALTGAEINKVAA